MRLFELLESEDTDWSSKLWIHFSDHPMVTMNPKGSHQDPAGTFFFPADHVPKYAIWSEKTYKFSARLKPGARVLELATMTDTQLDTILKLTGARAAFDAYIQQYPPTDRKTLVDMAWSTIRSHYMKSVPAAWTKALMTAGWDAVYDDSGAIHSSEPQQLVVLNPRVIKLVDMERQKMPVFASMIKVTNDIKELAAPYGPVTVEGPKRVKERYSNKSNLEASVQVQRSERNYIRFRIHYHDEERFRTQIQASVQYANPSLGYGCGATYNMVTGEYDRYGGLNDVERALNKVFAEEPKD